MECIIRGCSRYVMGFKYLWGWVDGELKLGLFTVIHGQTFH